MSDKTFVTGQSEIAERISKALGLGELGVKSLELRIEAEDLIRVDAVFYPTREQCEALGGEIEKFKQFGVVRGAVQFTYTEKKDDE
jgi:hypothetical protein